MTSTIDQIRDLLHLATIAATKAAMVPDHSVPHIDQAIANLEAARFEAAKICHTVAIAGRAP